MTATFGHSASLAAFHRSILYDNTKIAVARILGDGRRRRTRVFAELQSHYLFQDRFGRPGKGNDKGKVEGLVGYARRNFLVPIPVFESFEALNAYLVECCLGRMADRLRGHDETIAQRLERDLAAFQRPLPPPYDACDKIATKVSSLSLVRYRLNDYSVPTKYGHRDVLVHGYVHDVVISCGAEVIARHPRSYERDDFLFDPLHYLALIEQKINALDQAAPLVGWRLPEEFMTLRRLMEARMGKLGKREFVQVLRLMEVFPSRRGRQRGARRLARGAIGFDAVEVSDPVPHRAATAAPRHDGLSLSAASPCRDDVGQNLHELAGGSVVMIDTPQLLLAHHLKALKLPTFLRSMRSLLGNAPPRVSTISAFCCASPNWS